MTDGLSRQPKTRAAKKCAQTENALLNDLLQKQLDWRQAPDRDRSATWEQFMHALDRFSRAVFHGEFWTPGRRPL